METTFGSKVIVAVLSMGWFLTAAVRAQTNHLEIPAREAKNHIHEIATVYGKLNHVQPIRYGIYGIGAMLDVDGNYPNQSLNIVQLHGDIASFSKLKGFEGKEISVTGVIKTNRMSGLPGIIINSVDEISVRGQTNQSTSSLAGSNTNLQKTTLPNEIKATDWSWADADATNTIVTVLGRVYHHAKVTLVEPDGVTIKYTPDGGGFGGIKIPFEALPLKYQQQYGYDPQQAAAYVEAKEKKEEQQKQADQQAKAKQAQLDYEQAKEDYEQAKEEFDAEIKIQTLQAQQQTAQQTALQTRIMRAAAIERQIQEQQKLWEMQSQTYQQQRIADQINDLNWQLRMLMLNR